MDFILYWETGREEYGEMLEYNFVMNFCIAEACAGMKLLANNLDDMYRNVMSKIDDVEDIYNP